MKNLFNHEFKEFLTDRCDEMDYSNSSNYRKFDEKTEELCGKIKTALPEDLHHELLNLDDSYGDRQMTAANLSYQEGFMKGAQFLLNLLSNNADLSPELPALELKRDENLIIHQPGEEPEAPDLSNLSKENVRCIFMRIGKDIHCTAIGEPITKKEARLLYLSIKERLTYERPVIIRRERSEKMLIKLVKYSINDGQSWAEWMANEILTEEEIRRMIAIHYNVPEENVKIK